MCELNLRPSYGNKNNNSINTINESYWFKFDVVRPWQKIYNKSKEIIMKNISYSNETFYAYLDEYTKKKYDINDNDLALGIFSNKFKFFDIKFFIIKFFTYIFILLL